MDNNQINYITSPASPDYSSLSNLDDLSSYFTLQLNTDSKEPESDVQESKSEDKKPLPKFVIGIPNDSRNQTARQDDKFKLKRKLKKVKKGSKPFEWPAFPLNKNYQCETQMYFLLMGFPRSSVQAVQHFHKLIAPPIEPKISPMKPENVKMLHDIFFAQIRARWAFRKLALHFLKKRCKVINDEDPMTLEAIKQPIEIYSLKNKAIYRFEARSLARSFRSNLFHHDGTFPEPRVPTNPLTNLSLTTLQIHSITKSLRKLGHIDWTLDSFSSCGYDTEQWERKFSVPLKVQAIENVFEDKSSADRYEMLMDFAELQYDMINDVPFPQRLISFIFSNPIANAYAELWVKICKNFYIQKTLATEQSEIDDLEARSSIEAVDLIEVPKVIKVIYSQHIRKER